MTRRLNTFRKPRLVTAGIAVTGLAFALGSGETRAGATLEISKDASISIGAGMRAGVFAAEDGSPDGDSWSKDFDVQSIRLYMGGKLNENIKFTFNTEEILALQAIVWKFLSDSG